jgi:hypothetical protein
MRIVGFFCEDIRRERANTDSIVGILPDNMSISSTPAIIPKLAIYVRAHIDVNEPPHPIEMTLDTPWGETRLLKGAESSLVEQSQKSARDNNLPFGGIIMRALLVPFEVRAHGLVRVVATVAGAENTCALLNLRPSPASPGSSSAPAANQPSGPPAT